MSSINRPLSGSALRFNLAEEATHTVDSRVLETVGRNARTLAKEEGLRVTLVTLGAGGEVPEHHADGPVSVQALHGTIRVRVPVEGADYLLEPGTLLTLPRGLAHSVDSEGGGTFLLTVCWAPTGG